MQNPPAIKVHPISEGTKEVANIYDGLVKHIENESNSNDLRSAAFQDAVAGSIGVWKIVTKECDDYPGQLEIYEERIVDPTTVFPDPEAIDPTMCDSKWLFHIKDLDIKRFEKLYPDAETTDVKEVMSDWFKKDSVTIAEYWVKDGSKVSWYILNGNEILDSSEWKDLPYPGKYIPFTFILGEDITIDGTRTIKSIIRDSIDYQTTLNYMQSEAIDYVQKSAKTPWLASDASIQPYKKVWDIANTANLPFLPYVEGKEKPSRNDPPPAPVGYLEAVSDMSNSIKETVGIKDTFQDLPAGASGKAIKLQMAQSNIGTYVWTDHLNRAIKHAGKIIVDLIPHFYSHEHIQQILGIDGTISSVKIGGIDGVNLAGKYSVTLSTGASYEDQRQETNENMLDLFKLDPEMIKVFGDMFVRNMDYPESNQMADRLQANMNPKILAAGKNVDENSMKGQMMALTQQFQHAQQTIDQLTKVLTAKTQEAQMLEQKLQDKFATEQLRSQTELQKTQLDNKSSENIEQMKAEYQLKMAEMTDMLERFKAFMNPVVPEGPKSLHIEKHETNIVPPPQVTIHPMI